MAITTSAKNILWVDIAKFIAMFLVVFEHVVLAFKLDHTSYIAYIRNVIVTFHMPLFFLISGYLYKQKSKLENYEKILWALMVPYLIYQFAYLPLKLGYYHLFENIPLGIASLKCLIGILLGDNLGTEGSKYALSVCPAMWFVMVMIQLRFIFANINMTIKNLSIITIIAFVVLKILKFANIDLYFCLDNTLYAIPYFVAGYCIKNYFTKIIYFIEKYYFIIFLLLIIFLQISYFLRHNFNNILLLQYVCGFVGSFAIIALSQLFKTSNNFLNVIAKNTLFIIFFQSLFLFITKWVKTYNIMLFLSHNYEKFIFVIAFSFLIYIVSYFTIKLLERLNWNIVLGKYKRGSKCSV